MKNPYYDTEKLKENGAKLLDFIGKCYSEMENNQIIPKLEPGFLKSKLPSNAPEKGSPFEDILAEIKELILPGMTLWQHPSFFAYYPSNVSYPAILGEMFSSAYNAPCFTWQACPSSTELENIVSDWLVKMFNLPEKFLLKTEGGGGFINTISDGFFMSVNAAKFRRKNDLKLANDDPKLLKFVAYFPESCKSWSTKALILKDIAYSHCLPMYFDEKIQNYAISLTELENTIERDLKEGLIPFWFGATLGSTNLCAFDNITEIGKICNKYNIWLNVDAAYAGTSWICPEFRETMKGLEQADSLLINLSKNFLTGIVGAFIFIGNKKELVQSTGQVQAEVQKNKFTEEYDITDYKDWSVSFGRKFNSIKIYFLLKSFGVEGIQQHMRNCVELAKYFEAQILQNKKFEMICKRELALVCFRLKLKEGFNEEKSTVLNKKLLEKLKEDTHDGYISPSTIGNLYFLRFVVGNPSSKKEHIDVFWKKLERVSNDLINEI